MATISSSVGQIPAAAVQAKRPKRIPSRLHSRWLPLWFLLPSMLVLLVLQIGPTIYSFYLSTTTVTNLPINLAPSRYKFLFTDQSFRNFYLNTITASESQQINIGLGNFNFLIHSPTFLQS